VIVTIVGSGVRKNYGTSGTATPSDQILSNAVFIRLFRVIMHREVQILQHIQDSPMYRSARVNQAGLNLNLDHYSNLKMKRGPSMV
jgi:hypothetical protein